MPCLKYSVPIFVELIYKMQCLEVSCAVRPPVRVVRLQRVNRRLGGLQRQSTRFGEQENQFHFPGSELRTAHSVA